MRIDRSVYKLRAGLPLKKVSGISLMLLMSSVNPNAGVCAWRICADMRELPRGRMEYIYPMIVTHCLEEMKPNIKHIEG